MPALCTARIRQADLTAGAVPPPPGSAVARYITMSEVATFFGLRGRRTSLQDRTGRRADTTCAFSSSKAPDADSGSLFTALSRTWSHVSKQDAALPVIVIDHAERPRRTEAAGNLRLSGMKPDTVAAAFLPPQQLLPAASTSGASLQIGRRISAVRQTRVGSRSSTSTATNTSIT
jgi:hypothetical protein